MKMNKQANKWAKQYDETKHNPVYPTEWVIRTIAGANYPNFKHNKDLYKGKRIIDISCGDGRNLQLLLNLGFDVYATETSEETVKMLSKRFPDVSFSVGMNHKLLFSDNSFDYALSCGAFYYLDDGTSFLHNLRELNRILKPEATFFANMTKHETYVLNKAIHLGNGEYEITNDPHDFRNGYCWQVVGSKEELLNLIKPFLSLEALGETYNDYYGYIISNYIMVCKNKK